MCSHVILQKLALLLREAAEVDGIVDATNRRQNTQDRRNGNITGFETTTFLMTMFQCLLP